MEICHDDLPLFPHKMQLSQPLLGAAVTRCYSLAREYAAILKERPLALNVTCISDKADVDLDTYMNKWTIISSFA
jgi:hypothetical protein